MSKEIFGYGKNYNNYMKKIELSNTKNEEKKNLVDLGFWENEPVGFKFDRSINKPVLACRFDNYYYAYPTKTGWVHYRSKHLGKRDNEIEDISFIDWAYAVLKEVKLMKREIVDYDNKKYIKEITLYFNQEDKNDFLNDVDDCLKRNEIDPDVLFIALIETARDVCRVINADFEKYLKRSIQFGSVDDYFD